MELTPTLGEMSGCVGVGCASSLVSGEDAGRSRVHVAISRSDGSVSVSDVRLSAGAAADDDDDDDGSGSGSSNSGSRRRRRRDRAEEDETSSSLILLSMIRSRYYRNGGVGGGVGGFGEEEKGAAAGAVDGAARSVMASVLNMEGDEISERVLHAFGDDDDDGDGKDDDGDEDELRGVLRAARSVLSGRSDAVLLVPEDRPDSTTTMTAMSPHTILPPDPIIFPGSFNPPHAGHVALADAARRAMGRKRDEEFRHGEEERRRHRVEFGGGTEEFMMSALDYHDVKRGPPGILFEISLTNPDKDPISADEASKRVRLFLQRLEGEETEEKTKTTHPRMDWGVLLTSSPLFVQKAETVAECLSERGGKSANGGRKTSSRTRKMTFVIGADTMVRIVDPKYYGNSRDDMLEAVRDMGNRGVHFVAGGRLEQNKGKGKEDEG